MHHHLNFIRHLDCAKCRGRLTPSGLLQCNASFHRVYRGMQNVLFPPPDASPEVVVGSSGAIYLLLLLRPFAARGWVRLVTILGCTLRLVLAFFSYIN